MSHDPVVVNLLKKGLVDTSIRLIWPWHKAYDQITVQSISSDYYWINTSFRLSQLEPTARNEVYLGRYAMLKLRGKLMETLVVHVKHASRFISSSPWPGMENNIETAIRDSVPEENIWGIGIMHYSQICGMSPMAAYRELVLWQTQVNDTKLRLFAHMHNYANKINLVVNEKMRDMLQDQMFDTFMRDTMI
jgi:hypothetical protein